MRPSFQRSASIFLAFFLCFTTISCEEKVSMAVYYTSIEPHFFNFIRGYLPKIFENGLIDVVDLKFVPFPFLDCQRRGFDTCTLNKAELCVIDALPNVNEHFPFISCVENMIVEGGDQWETCSEKLNLNTARIQDCIHSFRLKQIEKRNAAEIKALQPPLDGVPWIVIDGQHVEDYSDFISYICKAYKGTTPLPDCSSSVNHVKLDASE